MNNNNMVNGNGLNVTESRKRITPDVLQELFMDYARELCAERLGDVKECSSYKEQRRMRNIGAGLMPCLSGLVI